MKKGIVNNTKLGVFTILLGAAGGAVTWLFLKALELCSGLVWEVLPDKLGLQYLPVILCVAAGVAAGLIRRKYGDYPEELPVVLGKIKRTKHYDYHPMFVMLVCAFIPLVFGASVGPEAGLTGIIAGLCYWVGDNVKYAKEHSAEYSAIGAAVTLSSLFRVPLFGIFAVEEEPDEEGKQLSDIRIPKTSKLLLYGLSIASAYLVMKGLGAIFRAAAEGFTEFEDATMSAADLALMILYIPIGFLLYLAFKYSEKGLAFVADKIPAVVCEAICGLGIGIVYLLVPAVLFSGEKQMGLLTDEFALYAPAALIGVCLLKIVMTAFCLKFGLKGGHFFPIIFACSCMGFGLANIVFGNLAGITDASLIAGHAVFASSVVTASTLGAQMKKPIAVALLLLICFPLKLVLWTFLAAAICGKIAGLFSR